MKLFSQIVFYCLVWGMLSGCGGKETLQSVRLGDFERKMVGLHVEYFQEQQQQQRLLLADAIERFDAPDTPLRQGKSQSIALGIGTSPAWLRFTVVNPESTPQTMRLAVETPWLDYVDTWLVSDGAVYSHVKGGDYFPYAKRPMPYRTYAFERPFLPGETQVYVRVETLGPMAIPIVLSTPQAAVNDDITTAYQYGVLYGIMLALALYNLVLFVIIRHVEFGLYALYLLGFVANSLSYTGQLHVLITGDYGVHFQDWLDNFLMITYSVAGLHFARYLLKTASYAPRLDAVTRWLTIIIPTGIVAGFVADQLVFSLVLAFILNSGFATLFIAMGIAARRNNVPSANLFIISSVTAAVCIGISTMAVAGLVPYNDYTFKAIEVGMAFEAIMLSVILAKIFRTTQQDLMVARKIAHTDVLTNIYNRRGFEVKGASAFFRAQDLGQDVSVVLIDIDHFKHINDSYGHLTGDKVIQATAKVVSKTARKSDVVARWGGEEFIMLLPDTARHEAATRAERLRDSLANLALVYDGQRVDFTVSIGIAGSEKHQFAGADLDSVKLETVIRAADTALYEAKEAGRNQISSGVNGDKAPLSA